MSWVITANVGIHGERRYLSPGHETKRVYQTKLDGITVRPSGVYDTKKAAAASLAQAVMLDYMWLDLFSDIQIEELPDEHT